MNVAPYSGKFILTDERSWTLETGLAREARFLGQLRYNPGPRSPLVDGGRYTFAC